MGQGEEYVRGFIREGCWSKCPELHQRAPPGISPAGKPPGQQDGRATEDCLFLDVLVPKCVYNGDAVQKKGKAPVLVWTFGGGFYEGSKESQGNPAGIIGQSISDPASSPGVVYVAMNYRLGALGWLSGPTFAASGGTPNAGLHDQRLALYWIQENIHLFGGDPNRVTIMGASGGAAMGMHQITAYGGTQDAPFQQAFLQSPAFSPNPYDSLQEETYRKFLGYANATSLVGLRAASSQTIIKANEAQIYNTTYGGSGFGPVVDGTIVPQLPTLSLAQGHRAKNVRSVFSGHNTDEGLIFVNPAIQNTSAFNTMLSSLILQDAPDPILNYVENTLYPPVFTDAPALGYNDTISRLATLSADLLLTCNVYALMEAFNPNVSHAYLFEEGASLHAEETPYMFYNYGPTPDAYNIGMVNGTVAKTLQDWVVTYGATGNPNGAEEARIPVYGEDRKMGVLSNRGTGISQTDTAGQERCKFWNLALYI